MKSRRLRAWTYPMLLLIFVSLLAWPAFVVASTVLAWIGADAWQLGAWSQIPKRVLLQQFLEGYQYSLFPALSAGLVVVVDYLLMSRWRITWWFSGMTLPLLGAGIALLILPSASSALPVLVFAGLLLAVAYRLFDLLAAIVCSRIPY